ncbi:protein GDAP2 homolog [Patiria miniata]|uniref:Ganglioside-induced differentiation-associated protein 2 n=1 Tax=Patiria miniata TaxID=46514 RepID=A0A914BTM5_PATMI|nr:protein GDAP2 homolog [Patiria miniata]XP_038079032.1 protein GDAP2 homolog [Patiria miniata]XP_038079033.1 protein GDAP2 homolog [Patiria miniata]XP_038079034.1 protein GDAP2 homolog [Patiria miniata]XP_038079035.1 protein GDAP2 homolog [Patiria miniata]
MEQLGQKLDCVSISSLPTWDDKDKIPAYNVAEDETRTSRFPYDLILNEKIVLWEGDPTALDAMGLIHPTNEHLNENTPLTEAIHKKAGPDLQTELIKTVRCCRTGEAKLSKGYNLPARFVIHTVGPRYNIRYRTAAESALYNCYRNALLLAREHELRTLAFCAINSVKRGYPPEEAAHIAIRTIRRFLEKHGEMFERIVFVIRGINEDCYQDLLPLYFPRSKTEEHWALDLIPANIGNEDGEPVNPERKIRITDDPTRKELVNGNESDQELEVDDGDIGNHAFASMQADPDKTKKELGVTRPVLSPEEEKKRRYDRFLRQSHTEDLSDIAAHRCIYQTGVDIYGRPIVAFVARNFPATGVDLEKAFLYFIYLLDPIVNQDYVVVYFHTLSTAQNQPDLKWLRQVYHAVDKRYRKHLRAFYIIHPTFWSRLVTWYFTTFTASSIKDKVKSLKGVHYLYNTIHPDQLDVPPFVSDYDMQINGNSYFNPEEGSEVEGL